MTTLHAHLAMFSVHDRADLRHKVADLCNGLAALAGKLLTPAAGDVEAWLCLDRHGVCEEEFHSKFTVSSIHAALWRRDADASREVYFTSTSVTIFNPDTTNLLHDGRTAYQKYLLYELSKSWRDAVRTKAPAQVLSILPRTRLWIYGQPERMHGYDTEGNLVPVQQALPEPEEAFVNYWLLLGIEPPAEDQDEAVSPDEIWRICMGTEPPEEPDE